MEVYETRRLDLFGQTEDVTFHQLQTTGSDPFPWSEDRPLGVTEGVAEGAPQVVPIHQMHDDFRESMISP